MSLYYEAAASIEAARRANESIKAHIYASKELRSSPPQIFALVTQATKWSPILKGVIEKSELLTTERKLTPVLALLLTHDFLISKDGVAAPSNHVLKLAITRHKARLSSELTRARLRLGYASVGALKAHVESEAARSSGADVEDGEANMAVPGHPRWIRVNTLRTSVQDQLATTFVEHTQAANLADLLAPRLSSAKLVYVDEHIPDLLALPTGTDLTKTTAYLRGELILQDKASCMPAYLLNPEPTDGNIIDACAAPGNKTTHLVALSKANGGSGQMVWACERDKARSETLKRMVHLAGVDQRHIGVRASQDFLRLSPEDPSLGEVGIVLLDPSCSGSGIAGRDAQDHGPKLVLPEAHKDVNAAARRKKRKRAVKEQALASSETSLEPFLQSENTGLNRVPAAPQEQPGRLEERLAALSTIQLKLLLHAFCFPFARKIAYSTCSVHAVENEHVVIKALSSRIARDLGWRILRRDEQVEGLRRWHIRGDLEACKSVLKSSGGDPEQGQGLSDSVEIVAEGCIRCNKGTMDGTMGFFVAGFVRDTFPSEGPPKGVHAPDGQAPLNTCTSEEAGDEEWRGFGDDDKPETEARDNATNGRLASVKQRKKKRKGGGPNPQVS